jgi:hypothetical protein
VSCRRQPRFAGALAKPRSQWVFDVVIGLPVHDIDPSVGGPYRAVWGDWGRPVCRPVPLSAALRVSEVEPAPLSLRSGVLALSDFTSDHTAYRYVREVTLLSNGSRSGNQAPRWATTAASSSPTATRRTAPTIPTARAGRSSGARRIGPTASGSSPYSNLDRVLERIRAWVSMTDTDSCLVST